ncbi:MAG: hypothetical protein IJL90_01480 [Lachnospiraceae bacterium]|nr:hypothetical protein [Lachnospiraceae bacterium]
MKMCPYCRIEVGGDLAKCPLCQSKLTGEGERAYFPKLTNLQRRSFLYKLQLFLVWIVVIASLGLDLLLHVKIPPSSDVHYSLLVSMWLIAFEFAMIRQFRKGTGSARRVTMMVLIILVLLTVTAYYYGFFRLTVDWIVPCAIAGMMITNFVLAMIDRGGNTMVYLLTNLLTGILPVIVFILWNRTAPVTWILCMLTGIILFVGAVIFKGRTVAGEIRKRLNL